MILYKSCTKDACSRVAALVGVGPIDTSCTFHGPTMTHQTDRIFNTLKATPQPNKTPCLTPAFFHFHSSLMHQQNSVNQKIREIFALQMEKLQHVKLCLSMLFNTSKLLRGAANCRTPILDKERSNRFVRMI